MRKQGKIPKLGQSTFDKDVTGIKVAVNSSPRVRGYYPLLAALTSTSWDGDSKGTGDNGNINVNSVFGVPSDAVAVLVRLGITDETVGAYALLGPNSSDPDFLVCQAMVTNQSISAMGVVNLDSGNMYFTASTTLSAVYIEIYGYWR